MDSFAVMVITVPVVTPIIVGLGFDIYFWGVLMLIIVELGLDHPALRDQPVRHQEPSADHPAGTGDARGDALHRRRHSEDRPADRISGNRLVAALDHEVRLTALRWGGRRPVQRCARGFDRIGCQVLKPGS